MNARLVSSRFPFIPIEIRVRQRSESVDALLDTGFDGAILAPRDVAQSLGRPDELRRLVQADGSAAVGFTYLGTVIVGPLGEFPVKLTVLGDEFLIGRGLSDLFTITLDHGRQLIVEP